MALSFKDSTGNYYLDQLYDNKFPNTAVIESRSGAAAGPNNAAGGTLIVSHTVTGWNAAATKSKSLSGVPLSANSAASGTLGHFRMKNAADTEREEGTITATGGGGDMTVDTTTVSAVGQQVKINSLTRTAP